MKLQDSSKISTLKRLKRVIESRKPRIKAYKKMKPTINACIATFCEYHSFSASITFWTHCRFTCCRFHCWRDAFSWATTNAAIS